MGLSLDEFRSYLLDAQARQSLGIQLSDAEAQQVVADPQASQSWYSYWQSTAQPAAPAETTPSSPEAPAAYDPSQSAGADAAPPAFAAAPPAHQAEAGPYAETAGYGATTGYPQNPTEAYPGGAPFGAPGDAPAKKKRTGLWVTLSIVGALLLIAGIVVILAFTTARHWTKTDVAEKPETFHTEEYETGRYNVADDGVSVCAIDQDWTDCANAMEAQYTAGCADVELTELATVLCARHRTEIDRMRSVDQEGYIVASLGSFGHLTRTPETATREVSNEDYEPAKTHEAVCYFEFLGECE
jgi:hypothetical protein